MQSQNAIETDDQSVDSELIQVAKDYSELLQAGKTEQAVYVFVEMCKLNQSRQTAKDNYLYREVGKMTRELHNSINQFVADSRIQMVAGEEMPDARQRLNHVVELTERSAHKTMSLIEHSSPLISKLNEKISNFQLELDAGTVSDKKLSDLFEYISSVSKEVSTDLNQIMLAQDYQDLTGQIIQRVSTLVQNVEDKLIGLLKITDGDEGETTIEMRSPEKNNNDVDKDNRGYGPAVPGVEKGDVLQSQDDVDDLLSSLGF